MTFVAAEAHVHHDGIGQDGICRTAAAIRQQVGNIEHLHTADQRGDQDEDHDRFDQRQCDIAEDLPVMGAVDDGCFVKR